MAVRFIREIITARLQQADADNAARWLVGDQDCGATNRLRQRGREHGALTIRNFARWTRRGSEGGQARSEEHTSELQSPCNLVCRLLLEKKKTNNTRT